ncbi:MAG: S-adenosylmethionine:tRNA ribosyltransferase-isomerase, partial [Candidatus Woesearchaeota archaeon]
MKKNPRAMPSHQNKVGKETSDVLDLDAYDYDLPKELIAQEPCKPRDAAKLLVAKEDQYWDKHFYEIEQYFKEGDVLVINTTKVLKNKLIGKKTTGAPVSLMLMQILDDYTMLCRIQSTKPLKVGQEFLLDHQQTTIPAQLIKRDNDLFYVQFKKPVAELFDQALLPNPPYIKHQVTDEEYQTVYATQIGSLAAPTAGLHFTQELIEKIKKKGVVFAHITLHIGYGTFLPIKDKKIVGHRMEEEWFEISQEAADQINRAKRLFAVGTTS